jgi:hypothetical protein
VAREASVSKSSIFLSCGNFPVANDCYSTGGCAEHRNATVISHATLLKHTGHIGQFSFHVSDLAIRSRNAIRSVDGTNWYPLPI